MNPGPRLRRPAGYPDYPTDPMVYYQILFNHLILKIFQFVFNKLLNSIIIIHFFFIILVLKFIIPIIRVYYFIINIYIIIT